MRKIRILIYILGLFAKFNPRMAMFPWYTSNTFRVEGLLKYARNHEFHFSPSFVLKIYVNTWN